MLTPFGVDGPRAGWQSSDLVLAAAGGVLSVTGTPDEPVTIWGRQMDNLGGLYAAICALGGLFRAWATGHGTTFDLSHQHCVVSCSEHVLMFWWWPDAFAPIGGPVAQRQLGLHWSRIYDVVPCRRGFCMVSPSAGGVPDLLAWMAERGHVPVPVDITDILALGNSLSWARCAASASSSTPPRCSTAARPATCRSARCSPWPRCPSRRSIRRVASSARSRAPASICRDCSPGSPRRRARRRCTPPDEPLTAAALDELLRRMGRGADRRRRRR